MFASSFVSMFACKYANSMLFISSGAAACFGLGLHSARQVYPHLVCTDTDRSVDAARLILLHAICSKSVCIMPVVQVGRYGGGSAYGVCARACACACGCGCGLCCGQDARLERRCRVPCARGLGRSGVHA